jgi:hypothetical protein
MERKRVNVTAVMCFSVEESLIMTLDKTTLSHLYLEEQLTIRAIAEKLSVSPRKVHNAMIRWRIPRRPNSARTNRPAPSFPLDEGTLRQHYHDAGQTIKQIAVQFKVSPWIVFSAMKYWDIPRRRCGPRSVRSWNE